MKRYDPSRIIILIPAYNEGSRVHAVVKDVLAHGFEQILVVDDCSTDNSMRAVRGEGVRVVSHIVNRGAGATTETGLAYCRTHLDLDAVITMDGDTQHDAADIDRLLKAHFEADADLTIGNRFDEENREIPKMTRRYNQVANITTSLICGKPVLDSQSGFKVISRRAVETIELHQDRFAHCSELIIKAHYHDLKVIHSPIKVYYPEEIRNKGQNFTTGVSTFFNLIQAVLFKNHR